MKKTYQQPTLVVMNMTQNLPIATSLNIDHTSQNNIQGDVKGEWGDIWDEELDADE